jgi:hypothetical protein
MQMDSEVGQAEGPHPRPFSLRGEESGQREGDVLAAARSYLARGWQVVPLEPRSKKPRHPGWPERRLGADDLAGELAGHANVGLLTGRASGGLVDVDLDAPEAIAAAPDLLPRTARIHGRAGKPASHYWYRVLAVESPHPQPLSLRGEGSARPDGEASARGASSPPSPRMYRPERWVTLVRRHGYHVTGPQGWASAHRAWRLAGC